MGKEYVHKPTERDGLTRPLKGECLSGRSPGPKNQETGGMRIIRRGGLRPDDEGLIK